MDNKFLARLGAFSFVGMAIAATTIEIDRPSGLQEDRAAPTPPIRTRDPLHAELARCSQIGEAGPRDPSCLKAWAENRRRFLLQPNPKSPLVSNAPVTLFPAVPASAGQLGSAHSVAAFRGER